MKKNHLIAIIMGGAVLGCAPAMAEDCDFNPGAKLKKLEVKPSATCTLTDAKVIGGAVVDSGGVLILNHSTIDGGLRADGGKLGIYATTDGPSVIHGGLTGYNLDALQIMGAVIDGQASVSGKAARLDFICSSTIGGGLTVSGFNNLVVGNPPDCKGNTITGGVSFTNSTNVTFNGNDVSGGATCSGTTFASPPTGNTITGSNSCF